MTAPITSIFLRSSMLQNTEKLSHSLIFHQSTIFLRTLAFWDSSKFGPSCGFSRTDPIASSHSFFLSKIFPRSIIFHGSPAFHSS
jgi:hypothetical protein